jgi:hypothetical protein
MTNDMAKPERGTEAETWWRRGAIQEAQLIVKDMTKDGHEVYEFVQVLAQQGRSGAEVLREAAIVYTVEWPLRDRFRLAWHILTRK